MRGCSTSRAFFVLCSILLFFLASISTTSSQPVSAPTLAPQDGFPAFAPAPSDDCFNSLLNMSDCLTFVEAESNLTTPDKGCCPSLAGLVESNPICLCQLLGSNANSFGVQIDVSKALQLPKACRVTTPPISLCSAVGVPVGVPTTSEGPSMPGNLISSFIHTQLHFMQYMHARSYPIYHCLAYSQFLLTCRLLVCLNSK
ncbi:hypothetical protein AQUCO_01400939v1 [Aquilegia coerulea]|uniref:Bifunctional inhibitor/plant lipid transfer protein/seed storage helical domain-containing protein n=1 Tax=Aquilegia coerulea TaxID=218851 RepID=A0A2G5DZ16_AQUCA|nr:hypothetical protein AQUCO_01400939v1 [Aquilegia coerulea]